MNERDRMINTVMRRPLSRRALLRSTLMAGASAFAVTTFGGGAVGGIGSRLSSFVMPSAYAALLDDDVSILNYALTLEYLEADAYAAINDAGVLPGRAATYFKAFGAHEAEHITALTETIMSLGGTPVQRPMFDFSGVPRDPGEIVRFFQMVEAVGASAYHGAAGSITNPDVLTAALQIHANEAEHAAALADLVAPGTALFSPAAFATPRTPDEVLAIVAPFLPGTGGGTPGMPATGGGGTSRSRTATALSTWQ
jgi:hypothetical protein